MEIIGRKVINMFEDTVKAWRATYHQRKRLLEQSLPVPKELSDRYKELVTIIKNIISLTNCCSITGQAEILGPQSKCIFCRKSLK